MELGMNINSPPEVKEVSKQALRADAHDCSLSFQMGQFYYAAKAFDALEKLDPASNYWEGKRGACVGVFQLILANKEPKYVCLSFLWGGFSFDHRAVCRNGCEV